MQSSVSSAPGYDASWSNFIEYSLEFFSGSGGSTSWAGIKGSGPGGGVGGGKYNEIKYIFHQGNPKLKKDGQNESNILGKMLKLQQLANDPDEYEWGFVIWEYDDGTIGSSSIYRGKEPKSFGTSDDTHDEPLPDGARIIAIVHTHPYGDARPSVHDVRMEVDLDWEFSIVVRPYYITAYYSDDNQKSKELFSNNLSSDYENKCENFIDGLIISPFNQNFEYLDAMITGLRQYYRVTNIQLLLFEYHKNKFKFKYGR